MTIDFKGFKVYKNEMLPPNTLMVSPDVYEKLTETPEQRQVREVEVKTWLEHFNLIWAKHPLNTLPKGPTQ